MKKRGILFSAVILLIFLFPSAIAVITGDIITGQATNSVGLNLTITAFFPLLSILSPENKTYLTNESLLLNFSVSSEETIWYNLDNDPNTTITSPTYINTSEGSHTLYLFANSSFGNITSKNVTFTIDLNIYNISYEKYKTINKGSSTDFIRIAYEDLTSLNDIVLENTIYGSITFNEVIDVINDLLPSDNLTDLDTHTNISFNEIFLNSTALPNFNKSATLIIHGLSFNNPRILKDREICPPSLCPINYYSEGSLGFNVTSFSTYSAEETPAGSSSSTSSGGGGSGGGEDLIQTTQSFSLFPKYFKISLKQGETKEEELIITNTQNQNIKISISSQNLENFLRISETEFNLEIGESKIIVLEFTANENDTPDLHVGKIIIDNEGITKEILIALEIESSRALFDVILEIPEKYSQIARGEYIVVNIKLFEVYKIGKVDVEIECIIKDENGKTIVSSKETIAIQEQANFVKSLKIPKDTKEGTYIFYIKVAYQGNIASASEWFEVTKSKRLKQNLAMYFIFGILLILFVIILLIRFKIFLKTKKMYKKLIKI